MEELAASVDLFLHKPREIENQKLICAACAADKTQCICPDDRRDRKATRGLTSERSPLAAKHQGVRATRAAYC